MLCLLQYRHAAQRRLVELPAGLCDVDGEEPLAVARRELREEGGVEAGEWIELGSTYSSPGISTEVMHFYVARDLRPADRGEFVAEHEEAEMETLWVPYDDLRAAVLDGRVSDAPVVVAVLLAEGKGLPAHELPVAVVSIVDGDHISAVTSRSNSVKVGVPKEVKNHEYRVAMTPVGVHELAEHGHEVFVEKGAGGGSQILDTEYVAAGATILDTADDVWGTADMVLKVKEPIAEEYHRMQEGQTLFTFLHLAADKPLTEELVKRQVTGIAYETVQLPSGALPLLYPMSEVAGCLAPQVGAHALLKAQGGRGVLLGGVGGVANAKVVVIGAGVAGQNAANIALGMGADVTLLDTDLDKLRMSFWRYNNRVHGLASSAMAIRRQVMEADLVIGAVLIPGAKAPKLVSNELVSQMKPGSVLVDIAVDQGGCFEDTRPTTHADPTYPVHESVFYCVANMPGAVPNTSTYALTNATLPYTVALADKGWKQACLDDPSLALGLNTHAGQLTNAPVGEAVGMDAVAPELAMS